MKKYAPIFIIIAAVLWGLDGIVLRPSLYALPVPLVVFVEHALAFLILIPFLIKEFKEVKKLKKGDWGAFVWIAVFGGAIGTMAITKALFYVDFVNLSVVILLQKFQPLFAILLAWLVLKEKLPKKFFVWAGLAIIGGYFVTFGLAIPNLSSGEKIIAAALFSLLASFSFASSTVFSKRALQKINFRVGVYLRFGVTTLIMFLVVLGTGNISNFDQITLHQLLYFLIIVFSSGGLALFFYYYGLKFVTASVSTICELAFPLSAILFEYVIRGNVLSWVQWLGAIVLMYSIYRVTIIKEGKTQV
ncbi:DMT family transporter [bacterium]|jgi:drug/metabolite transporter (DMT)-like permease|nr:DMT family transporter [bacterium]MBT4121458.1 DMT family transporter [bacterium]MBT4495597.1 DMT family transporter [bacterium]MBT4764255.1 DMT family transporter [bacterium]MBT5401627.1 DMT family transporter [bacterium]